MEIKYKKLTENAVAPAKAHKGDAAFDMRATSVEYDDEHDCWIYGTGIAMEVPEGYCAKLYPRSSICRYDLSLSNCVGIIDSNYRGEIKFVFRPMFHRVRKLLHYLRIRKRLFDFSIVNDELYNIHKKDFLRYGIGDKIGQVMIEKLIDTEFVEVDGLSDTDRGTGGFGSSGR